MPADLQPPPDAISLLDGVEQYVRLDVPDYHQRLKALCAFRRGWGTRARELSWDDLSVWPEEDERLWILIAENFLTQWARELLRVWGCDSNGGWHQLSPVLGDSILVTEIDWSRGIIFPGTARPFYGIRVAPPVVIDQLAAALGQVPAEQSATVDIVEDAPAPDPVDSYRTGGPGRPTAMHLVLKEHERRKATGELASTRRQQANDLLDWFINTHPDAPRLTAKTIFNQIGPMPENNLCDAFNKVKKT
jgi:hypothetical protein